MSDSKVIRLKDNCKRRKNIEKNLGKLHCEVSSRWVEFPNSSDKHVDMDYLHLDIMTMSSDKKKSKICELVVDRDALEQMLKDLPHKNRIK